MEMVELKTMSLIKEVFMMLFKNEILEKSEKMQQLFKMELYF